LGDENLGFGPVWIGLDWIGLDWIGLDWIGFILYQKNIYFMTTASNAIMLFSRSAGQVSILKIEMSAVLT